MEIVAEDVETAKNESTSKEYFVSIFHGNLRIFAAFSLAAFYAYVLGGVPLMGLVIGCLLVFVYGCDAVAKAINNKGIN